ncbi:Indoleamine 2,3-dioxygenase [Trametopsis cervina]|nr:Indoleamine 2,3-dioxygenase [Trametopsis cervina]
MSTLSSPVHLMKFLGALDVRQVARSLSGSLATEQHFCPKDFDVDHNTGFFPPEPLPRLPRAFSMWEDALAEAQHVLSLGEDESDEAKAKRPAGEQWRAKIRSWPVLDTTVLLGDIRQLQKAHLVLAFLLHFYVHSIPLGDSHAPMYIPKPISIPIVAVSKELGTAPVMTFADTVLWNWDLIHPDQPLSPDNIRYVNLFSGTETERAFYVSSGAVELKGVEMLQVIESFHSMPNVTDLASVTKIARDLGRLKGIVDDLTEIFGTIRDTVDPESFHWQCRPWWCGSGQAASSTPQWIYEGVSSKDTQDLAGPSAGQSSVMHALDIFLDIDHKLAQKRTPAPSESNKKADTGFMDRMRRYMPGKHRDYLAYLSASSRTIRDVALAHPNLKEPYNEVVAALKRLRDVHIRVVTLYVVTMSHREPPAHIHRKPRENGVARGTGGMEASNLLKAGRDATARAMLKD